MYATVFDIDISTLRKCYGDPYNGAYDEIRATMAKVGFDWVQGGVYITHVCTNGIDTVYRAIQKLSSIDWFKQSVRDIRAFKVEDWSDFTAIVKE